MRVSDGPAGRLFSVPRKVTSRDHPRRSKDLQPVENFGRIVYSGQLCIESGTATTITGLLCAFASSFIRATNTLTNKGKKGRSLLTKTILLIH